MHSDGMYFRVYVLYSANVYILYLDVYVMCSNVYAMYSNVYVFC